MKKDVIYIDVEDDITAIIGKVKASKEKVIVLVPPKRIGLLQSAVNLRLLDRAAKQAGKQLAIVTNNTALTALAAAATIPVAKNLQSKPELAEIPALEVNGEDIIDGADLPIGDHARLAEDTLKANTMASVLAANSDMASKPTRTSPAKKIKVPNFGSFRKRLFLGIAAGVFLIAFLVWGFVIAPRATVIISAKTTSSSINKLVTISTKAMTNFDKATLLATAVEQAEDKSIDFTPTGNKDIGSKAIGDVNFRKSTPGSVTINAGTKLTSSSGLVFVVTSEVEVPGAELAFTCPNYLCPGTASGSVEAAEPGSKYNAATGNLSGAPGETSTTFDGPTSGGVSKIVTVVTQDDVNKALESFIPEDGDQMKDVLKKKFQGDVVSIDESFIVDKGTPISTPAIDAEASDGKATLKGRITYRLLGIKRDEVNSFLNSYMQNELKDASDQRVYENGAKDVLFQDVTADKDKVTATLIATTKVGPKIEDSKVKELAKGKRYGEIQQALETIPGVDSVDVKFFPFWLNRVSQDEKRIVIEFKLDE